MESAGAGALPGSVEERVHHHTAVLHQLGTAMDQVMATMERWERGGLPTPVSATPQSVPLPSPSLHEHSGIRLVLPREYDGTAAGCQGFLLQIDLYLATVRPAPSGALEWANAVWNDPDSARDNYPEFTRRFRAVFDHPPEGRAAGWNDRALIDHYRCSLREDVRRELACRDTTLSLDQLIDMSIRLDNLLATRGRPDRALSVPFPSSTTPTPMELGGAAARATGGGGLSCANCGRRGHTADRCWGGPPGSRDARPSTARTPQPVLVPWHQSQTEAPVVDDWVRRSRETWEAAYGYLKRAEGRQKASADRRRSEAPVHTPGDRVWPVVAGPLQEDEVREIPPPPLDIGGGRRLLSLFLCLFLQFQANVDEGSTGVVVNLTVDDRDDPATGAWRAIYSIINGDPTQSFEIQTNPDNNEGMLSLIKPLDYESLVFHTLLIKVENEDPLVPDVGYGSSSTATIHITILDVNEGPVFFPDPLQVTKMENVPLGSFVALLNATDPDVLQSQSIRFAVLRDPANWLSVNPVRGTVNTSANLDRESPYVQDNKYTAIFMATDNGSPPATGTGTLVIHLEDYNDNAPYVHPSVVRVCEDAKDSVVIVGGRDRDIHPNTGPFKIELGKQPGLEKTWKVSRVNNTHAQIMLLQNMKRANYQLPLVVTDSGLPPLSNSTEVKVQVCTCKKNRMDCSGAGSERSNLMLLLGLVLLSLICL
ncbi:uncharacterized protein LOC129866539 [Salvelinus fontinalis]|uniref:uncharacterized protein LOC129866539 n=1 Tax=Salvelinus fontinalis TaxID=8038 RepID=UPI0024852176|nr:uncharacterized protein LOC129866539 [Salvelinus fontinalis]